MHNTTQLRDTLGRFLLSHPQTRLCAHNASWDGAERGSLPAPHPLNKQNFLVSWLDSLDAGSVRWILGSAGTGKTLVARRMAKYCAERGCLAANFFFSRAPWAGTNTTQPFSGVIAYQLLRKFELSFPDIDGAPSCSWHDVVHALSQIPPRSPPMVIIVDGLDECQNPDEQVELLKEVLCSLDQIGPSVKFLIACRPEQHLETVFDKFAPILSPSYRINLDQPNDEIQTLLSPPSHWGTRPRSPSIPKIAPRATWDTIGNPDVPTSHPDSYINLRGDLAQWLDEPRGSSVRWISGSPGTGKTTIAQTMAEYWEKQRRLAASFFFSRLIEESSTTQYFPATIACQLEWYFRTLGGAFITSSPFSWADVVRAIQISSPLSPSAIIVIDGLDECHNVREQVILLRELLESAPQLEPSIKFLISHRPEHHLEQVYQEFNLSGPRPISTVQTIGDSDEIRTFFRRAFHRIREVRRLDNTISITDRSWPSDEEIDELVDRAKGRFTFATNVIACVRDETEDPVRTLRLVLNIRTPSFTAMDSLYLTILEQVARYRPTEYRHVMSNILLHLSHEPSLASDIAQFWFHDEDTINVFVRHLKAILVRPDGPDGQIHFRDRCFHNFFARPSSAHPFSLAEMDPVSKFFFSLRMSAKTADSHTALRRLSGSQWLGYTFLCCDDHPPAAPSSEEDARQLHWRYLCERQTSPGCPCLQETITSVEALLTLESCGQDDCDIDEDVLRLCRMIEMPVDLFVQAWAERERTRPILSGIIKSLLWLRVLFALFDPLSAWQGMAWTLLCKSPNLSLSARCVAVCNALLCVLAVLSTRSLFTVPLYASHTIISLLLHQLFRFGSIGLARNIRLDGSDSVLLPRGSEPQELRESSTTRAATSPDPAPGVDVFVSSLSREQTERPSAIIITSISIALFLVIMSTVFPTTTI